MKPALIAYAGTFGTLLIADALWLGVVARTFYRQHLGDLMLPSPNFAIAALFYVFFAVATVALVVLPGVKSGTVVSTLLYGGLLGMAAYGTYDITNLATLKSWPVIVTVVDLVWGTFVTALSAGGGYMAVRMLTSTPL